MTDNGSCHISKDFAKARRKLGLKHVRTKPYTPRTNGKAERFIQTALREWACARAYPTSEDPKTELPVWTRMYNWHRPQSALKAKPPISRLPLERNNLLRLHILGLHPGHAACLKIDDHLIGDGLIKSKRCLTTTMRVD